MTNSGGGVAGSGTSSSAAGGRCPALDRVLELVGTDEAAHGQFFRRLVSIYLEDDRAGTIEQLRRVLNDFKMPATHLLVVRHYDRVGVLSAVFGQLKQAGINVQETENVVFEGAAAAVARVHLDSAPPQGALDAMRAESPDIIELSVLRL